MSGFHYLALCAMNEFIPRGKIRSLITMIICYFYLQCLQFCELLSNYNDSWQNRYMKYICSMNKDISDSKINDNYKVMEVVYYQDQYYTFMVESEVFGAGLFQLVPQFCHLLPVIN